jgi:hypothetical protein
MRIAPLNHSMITARANIRPRLFLINGLKRTIKETLSSYDPLSFLERKIEAMSLIYSIKLPPGNL